MPKKVFSCTVCDILKDCNEKKEIIDNVDNVIFNSKTAKDIEGLFNTIDLNNQTLPSWHYVKKHRDNCLKDFNPPLPPKIENTIDKKNNEDYINKRVCGVEYTDYSDVDNTDIQRCLRVKLLHISAKLIDHVEYELMDFSKAKPNIKDTVSTLKTTIDLMNFSVVENLENKNAIPRLFISVRGEKESDLYEADNKIYRCIETDNGKDSKIEFVGYKSSDGKIVKKENVEG